MSGGNCIIPKAIHRQDAPGLRRGLGRGPRCPALLVLLLPGTFEEGIQICAHSGIVAINLQASLEVGAFFEDDLAGVYVTHNGSAFDNFKPVMNADIAINLAGDHSFAGNDVGIQARPWSHGKPKTPDGNQSFNLAVQLEVLVADNFTTDPQTRPQVRSCAFN